MGIFSSSAFVFVATCVLCLLLGIYIGSGVELDRFRNTAVENGHAHYVLRGNQAVWEWKEFPMDKGE